jgi:hypothetical protein
MARCSAWSWGASAQKPCPALRQALKFNQASSTGRMNGLQVAYCSPISAAEAFDSSLPDEVCNVVRLRAVRRLLTK